MQEAKEWEAKSEEKRWWSDYSWGQVYFGATAVLYERTGDAFYAERLAYFADSHMNSKNGIKRTPCGLSFVTKWGSCRHAAGCAGIIASYARGLLKADPKSAEAAAMLEFAESQVRVFARCLLRSGAAHPGVVLKQGLGCRTRVCRARTRCPSNMQ